MKNLKKMYETSSFEDEVFDVEPEELEEFIPDWEDVEEEDIWDDKDEEYIWDENDEEIEEDSDYIWDEEEEEEIEEEDDER